MPVDYCAYCKTCFAYRKYQWCPNCVSTQFVYHKLISLRQPPPNSYNNVIQVEEMSQINITWNPDIEAYETSFPYNKIFIEWIKSSIPSSNRSLDYDRNRDPQYKWLFDEKTLETVVLPMMRLTFRNAYFNILDKKKVDEYNQGFQKTKAVDTNALKQEFRALVIAAGVSTKLSDRKQYLKAAMFYHPDRNPDKAAQMSRLNEIWTSVFQTKEQEQIA